MLNKLLSVVVVVLSLVFAQNETDSAAQTEVAPSSAADSLSTDEESIVKVILEKCGLNNVSIQDVATMESGRVISLDLTNKDIAKDGISIIPAEIGKLTSLRRFTCNNNIVTELPDEIGNLTELQSLILQSNRIAEVPAAIGKCINIVDLDLRHNQLSEIPSEIGNLKKLQRLWLWGNKLTSLNDEITAIKSLKELYLKDNRLTTLPENITKTNIVYIDIIGNKICKPSPVIKTWLTQRNKRFLETQKCW